MKIGGLVLTYSAAFLKKQQQSMQSSKPSGQIEFYGMTFSRLMQFTLCQEGCSCIRVTGVSTSSVIIIKERAESNSGELR